MADDFVTIDWTQDATIRLIDPTRLPLEEVYVECQTVDEVARAIRTMQVRGAPAIGIAAAMGLALGARGIQAPTFQAFFAALEGIGAELMRTRPTAVNLAWAVRRILQRTQALRDKPLCDIPTHLAAEARAMATREMPALPRADATREMPALPAAARPEATKEKRAARRRVAEEPEAPLPRDERDLEVVRDAVRLLGWGRDWHELPEAIARMAGRPDKTRVRGILQSHRAAIERQASAAPRSH